MPLWSVQQQAPRTLLPLYSRPEAPTGIQGKGRAAGPVCLLAARALDDTARRDTGIAPDIEFHGQHKGAHHEHPDDGNHQPFEQRHAASIKKRAPPCDGAPGRERIGE
jgi:hypothetical protein